MPGSCGKSVGEELFHTINNLDEDMNLVFIISSSHFCSEYFYDALQCKTRKSYFFLLYGYPDCIQYSVFLDSKICQKKKKNTLVIYLPNLPDIVICHWQFLSLPLRSHFLLPNFPIPYFLNPPKGLPYATYVPLASCPAQQRRMRCG